MLFSTQCEIKLMITTIRAEQDDFEKSIDQLRDTSVSFA